MLNDMQLVKLVNIWQSYTGKKEDWNMGQTDGQTGRLLHCLMTLMHNNDCAVTRNWRLWTFD